MYVYCCYRSSAYSDTCVSFTSSISLEAMESALFQGYFRGEEIQKKDKISLPCLCQDIRFEYEYLMLMLLEF